MAMLFRTTMLINGMLCSIEALYGITNGHLDQLESCSYSTLQISLPVTLHNFNCCLLSGDKSNSNLCPTESVAPNVSLDNSPEEL